MKKLICIVLLVIITFSFSGCAELLLFSALLDEDTYASDGELYVEDCTGIEIPRCEELEYVDNTGITGGGDIYIRLCVPQEYRDSVERSVLKAGLWRPLPMSKIMSKEMVDKDGRTHTIKDYVGDHIPEIKEGYWYFYSGDYGVDYLWDKDYVKIDRFRDFEIAVYSTATDMIYYFSYCVSDIDI